MSPDHILKRIAEIRRMERGGLSTFTRHNRDGEPVTYHVHNEWVKGRNHTRYVSAAELPELKRLIKAHERFRNLVTRYVDVIVTQTRRERLAVKTREQTSSLEKDQMESSS
jgi:hypothetical protein